MPLFDNMVAFINKPKSLAGTGFRARSAMSNSIASRRSVRKLWNLVCVGKSMRFFGMLAMRVASQTVRKRTSAPVPGDFFTLTLDVFFKTEGTGSSSAVADQAAGDLGLSRRA